MAIMMTVKLKMFRRMEINPAKDRSNGMTVMIMMVMIKMTMR